MTGSCFWKLCQEKYSVWLGKERCWEEICENAHCIEYQCFFMSITVSGQTACKPCLDFEGYTRTLNVNRNTSFWGSESCLLRIKWILQKDWKLHWNFQLIKLQDISFTLQNNMYVSKKILPLQCMGMMLKSKQTVSAGHTEVRDDRLTKFLCFSLNVWCLKRKGTDYFNFMDQ